MTWVTNLDNPPQVPPFHLTQNSWNVHFIASRQKTGEFWCKCNMISAIRVFLTLKIRVDVAFAFNWKTSNFTLSSMSGNKQNSWAWWRKVFSSIQHRADAEQNYAKSLLAKLQKLVGEYAVLLTFTDKRTTKSPKTTFVITPDTILRPASLLHLHFCSWCLSVRL